jgi:hypothetical protein
MRNKTSKKSFAFRLFVGLLVLTFFLFAVHLILQYLNLEVYDEKAGQFFELTNRFDLDDESSFPTWVSQFMLIIISLGAGLAAYIEKKVSVRRVWAIVSAVALLGSIDEVSTLHESILQAIHVLFFKDSDSSGLANAWVIITPVVLFIVAIFIYSAIKVLPNRTIKLFIYALVPYLLGSIVIDLLTVSDLATTGFFDQGLMVGIEEALEILGLSIGIYAVADYLETHHKKRITESINHLTK